MRTEVGVRKRMGTVMAVGNKQTDKQTKQHYQKHNSFCQGGKKKTRIAMAIGTEIREVVAVGTVMGSDVEAGRELGAVGGVGTEMGAVSGIGPELGVIVVVGYSSKCKVKTGEDVRTL